MIPGTVIVLLAAQLAGAGLLLFAFRRRLSQHGGLSSWASALLLLGLALAGQLAGQRAEAPEPHDYATLPAEVTMVFACLLMLRGLRQFMGRASVRLPVVSLLLGYAALHVGVAIWAGAFARQVELRGAIALVAGLIAATASREARALARGDVLRAPLWLLSAWLGALAVLAAWQAALPFLASDVAAMHHATLQAQWFVAALATSLLPLLFVWMLFGRDNQQLLELASRDPLTRVLNRNGLDDVLRRHFGARDAAPLTLLLVDLDHFKQTNDQHGHEAGDALLRAVAGVLTEHVRGNDFVVRTGGEEFLVGCVGTNAPAALALGERLRHGIGQLRVPWPGAVTALRCTASVGISSAFSQRAHWTHAARQADRALYVAKSTGRDRVISIEGIDT